MDKSYAKALSRSVKGKTCNGWVIGDYINCGKSAIVLHGEKNGTQGAIKIFDPELVKRFGADVQRQRIEREISLVGLDHPHLVKILDGGVWKKSARKHLYYIVMEYLPWKNLKEALVDLPRGVERQIIAKVASAAHFLETHKICHRDIKPENICISDDGSMVKLLDLGVVRVHGSKGLTDGTHGKVFIGTLKYSPPEFLLRVERDNSEGWRAITFYQLGGVLHDLINRHSLFEGMENPYAKLVNAVQHDIPEIESDTVSPALVELAKTCLLKDPDMRLKYVSWSDFYAEPANGDIIADLQAKITKRQAVKKTKVSTFQQIAIQTQKLREYFAFIESVVRLECIKHKDIFPPISLHRINDERNIQSLRIDFEPSKSLALSHHLRVQLHLSWLDPDSDFVQFEACAYAYSLPFDAELCGGYKNSLVQAGPYTESFIRKHVIYALYSALDLCQQLDTKDVMHLPKCLTLKTE